MINSFRKLPLAVLVAHLILVPFSAVQAHDPKETTDPQAAPSTEPSVKENDPEVIVQEQPVNIDNLNDQRSWQLQVQDIRKKYIPERTQLQSEYTSKMSELEAHALTQIGNYRSKHALLDSVKRAQQAYDAVKDYRSKSERNKQEYIAAYNALRTDPETRQRLLEGLLRGIDSPKAKASEKTVALEEKVFQDLYSLYDTLALNQDKWDLKEGGTISFKNRTLARQYKQKERQLNDSIRELDEHRRVAKSIQ